MRHSPRGYDRLPHARRARHRGKSLDEAARIRTAECEAACRIIGATPVFLAKSTAPLRSPGHRWTRCSDCWPSRPPMCCIHTAGGHPHGSSSGEYAHDPRLDGGGLGPTPLLLEVDTGSQTEGFLPNTYVDVSPVLDQKKRALFAHVSQDGQGSGGSITKSWRSGAGGSRCRRCRSVRASQPRSDQEPARPMRKIHRRQHDSEGLGIRANVKPRLAHEPKRNATSRCERPVENSETVVWKRLRRTTYAESQRHNRTTHDDRVGLVVVGLEPEHSHAESRAGVLDMHQRVLDGRYDRGFGTPVGPRERDPPPRSTEGWCPHAARRLRRATRLLTSIPRFADRNCPQQRAEAEGKDGEASMAFIEVITKCRDSCPPRSASPARSLASHEPRSAERDPVGSSCGAATRRRCAIRGGRPRQSVARPWLQTSRSLSASCVA